MELGQIEVVVVCVQELVGILFVHAGATQPNTTVASLDWSLAHVEVAKGQVVVQLLWLVFGGIVSNELDLRLFIERPWRQKPISSLDFSLDK